MMVKILLSILFIIGTVATGILYLNPAWKEFQTARQRNQSLETISAELDALIENRDELMGLINRISKKDLERIDQAIPLGQNGEDLVVTLENAAIQNGVFLRTIDLSSTVVTASPGEIRSGTPRPSTIPQPGQTNPPGGINELPVGMNVSGSYEPIKTFLATLEKNLRIINLKTLVFSSPDETDKTIDINLSAVTYYQQ